MKRILIGGLLTAFVATAGFAQSPSQSPSAAQSPDNTGNNAQQGFTAEDQGEQPHDRDLTSQIRSTIMQNNSLSTNAKNVKIITRNGKVTLRGPVDSQQEKQTLDSVAEGFAGKANVNNQIEVQPTHQ